jgi:hypothetical protein
MTRLPLAILAALVALPAAAQEAPRYTLEHRMLLRCSAAFAIVAGEQARGMAPALAYPPLGERGREYFVRSSVRLMDELKLPRQEIEASLRAEVETLQQASAAAANPAGYLDGVMQPCLSALEASGL